MTKTELRWSRMKVGGTVTYYKSVCGRWEVRPSGKNSKKGAFHLYEWHDRGDLFAFSGTLKACQEEAARLTAPSPEPRVCPNPDCGANEIPVEIDGRFYCPVCTTDVDPS